MTELSYSGIQEALDNAALDDLPKLNISVLRNIILEPVEPYLRYAGYQIGFDTKVRFGEFDNILQDAISGGELLGSDTDCVLVFPQIETLSVLLTRQFTTLDAARIAEEQDRITGFIHSVLSAIRQHTGGMILLHGFELPQQPALGILDSQAGASQRAAIDALNESARALLAQTSNAYMVDMNLCLGRVGARNFYDPRYWHIGRAPYTKEALKEIAHEDFRFIRPLKGRNKKCLVLDCDNTLWGGIVGEDGLTGIKLGRDYPGSSYHEFQQEVLNLQSRGVLIALCSKNNEEDVREVFEKHPDMLLREEHVTASQVNWDDKAVNLRRIAEELNIGLDSLVFVDDSEFEVNLVREMLPEVTVIHIPKGKAVEARNIIASCGLFDTLTLTAEDRKRTAMYKAEGQRKKLQQATTDLGAYYRSLEMRLRVKFADAFTIPRIAQLTQKTNQFNLTTTRYSEADIQRFSEDEAYDVITLQLSDRFDDTGIVGVCIIDYRDAGARIDTLLMSCRILGRGVEDAFLTQILKAAKNRGSRMVDGRYIPTRKNGQVKDFYSKRRFTLESQGEDGGSLFRFPLDSDITPEPDFFQSIESDIDQQQVQHER